MNKDNIGDFTTSQLNGLMKDLKKLNIAAESNWGDDWMHTDRPAIWIHAEGVTDETTLLRTVRGYGRNTKDFY